MIGSLVQRIDFSRLTMCLWLQQRKQGGRVRRRYVGQRQSTHRCPLGSRRTGQSPQLTWLPRPLAGRTRDETAICPGVVRQVVSCRESLATPWAGVDHLACTCAEMPRLMLQHRESHAADGTSARVWLLFEGFVGHFAFSRGQHGVQGCTEAW